MRHIMLGVAGVVLVLAAAVSIGYRGDAKPSGDPSDAETSADARPRGIGPVDARSPAETVRLLSALHRKRDYAAVAPLIVEDCREETIDLLKAVDEVLTAHEALHATARNRYGPMTVQAWDLSAMSNNLGPFSARVTLISQRFKGNQATVTLQEGENVPLIHARLDLGEEGWLYRPEPTPPEMPAELRELARTLREIEASVDGGAAYEYYDRSFFDLILPRMSKIALMENESPTQAVAAIDEPE